jgi:hypothetical protein
LSETVRIYVNGQGVDVPASVSALEALTVWNPVVAATVRSGERLITDSRGIAAAHDGPVHNGAIFRIVRARQANAEDNDPDQL